MGRTFNSIDTAFSGWFKKLNDQGYADIWRAGNKD